MGEIKTNVLYFGDNLDILRNKDYFPDSSVDLVYLDPPFNSKKDYNILFKENGGVESEAQIQAFTDSWHWTQAAQDTYQDIVINGPGKVSTLIGALHEALGNNDVMAYLVMMTARLIELHRVLAPTGSLYLHCDPTASHYLKLVLDQIFGPANFRNEIVWRRTASHNQARRYGPIHDIIFFYSKTERYFFKVNFRQLLKGHVEQYFRKEDEKGRYWTNALTGAGIRRGESGESWKSFNPTERNRHWAIPGSLCTELGIPEEWTTKQKLDALFEQGLIGLPPTGSKAMPTYKQYLGSSSGIPLQDIWSYQPHTKGVLYQAEEGIDEDVRWLTRQGDPERLGYETQKPLGLLQRIINSSCPEQGIILDPFCGCGTAVVAAQKLNRKWIGIDITHLAINLMRNRLKDSFNIKAEVIGEPADLGGAKELASQPDKYQFQWWALGLIGARPAGEKKKGADKGIDGVISFIDDPTSKPKRAIVQVKSGHVHVKDIRELKDVSSKEAMGIFITLEPPTKDMSVEAVSAGYYHSPIWNKDYPRIQILTIEELLHGKAVEMPQQTQTNVTFAKAPKISKTEGKQLPME